MAGGLLAILSHETGRFAAFWESSLSLNQPEQADIQSFYGDVAQMRNAAFRQAEKLEKDWVWFLDDDHAWDDPDLLHKLLARDVDIVQPGVLRRYLPFTPVVSRLRPDGEYDPQTMEELGPPGIVPVTACGMGMTLIRRRVWEGMERPWFRMGEIAPDKASEDIGFTRRASDAGFGVYVDTENCVDHLKVIRVRPKWNPSAERWETALVVDTMEICTPAVRKKRAEPSDVLANFLGPQFVSVPAFPSVVASS